MTLALPQALKFVVVGGANSAIGLAVIYLSKWLSGAGDLSANLFGYAAGLSVSFAINRSWTFQHGGPWQYSALRFLLVAGVAYIANLATVMLLVGAFGIDGYLAQPAGILPYALLFYLGSRHFAFRAERIRSLG